MRVDHHAYQRATRVAGVGFLLQLAMGLTLLIFSLAGGEAARDTTFFFGSVWILFGLLVWLGLLVIFNQHKLERLEALEEDELATRTGRGDDTSVFSPAADEVRVAARRLRQMHHWLMPVVSLVLAAGLGFAAWRMLRGLGDLEGTFHRTELTGWAVAICLAFAAVSFIFSRFVAGMAKLEAWQNLRGGAAYMVGNSLVTLAIAVGIGFRFFKNDDVIMGVAYAIPIFLIVIAGEIVLNFVLNLYRPRIADQAPRPAFDSKLLSLFSAPDNLVRSINEAVNYQFGFDITSSWGYQLLIRSFAWLIGLGLLALLLLNTMVIVEPNQQAVKLSGGEIVGNEVHSSGIMWKLPWPLQTAEVYDVSTIRELHLTGRQVTDTGPGAVQLWTDDLGHHFDKPLDPFLVGRSQLNLTAQRTVLGDDEPDISWSFALVDAELALQYRIREEGGLLRYLHFSRDIGSRRDRLTMLELAMKSIALREVTQEMTGLSLDEVLGAERPMLAERLRRRIQAAFDENEMGVELVAVDIPLLRPTAEAAGTFENLSLKVHAREQAEDAAEQLVVTGLAQLIGDPERAADIVPQIDRYNELRDAHGRDDPRVLEQQVKVEQMLFETGGYAAQIIAAAERNRWVDLMQKRAQASRIEGQIAAYRAAPNLYRERMIMSAYKAAMPRLYKYIVGVDPSRVNFDVDLEELTSMFNFAETLGEDEGVTGQ